MRCSRCEDDIPHNRYHYDESGEFRKVICHECRLDDLNDEITTRSNRAVSLLATLKIMTPCEERETLAFKAQDDLGAAAELMMTYQMLESRRVEEST